MKIIETFLKGCFIIEPTFFKDNRGCFLLEYNKKEFQEKIGFEGDFVLGNQSTSQYGVVSAENNKQLFVPRGFLHGFSVLENDTIVSYKCDNYYEPEAEDGVLFNDVDLNIDWRLSDDDIIISEKDKVLLSFSDFKNI